MEQASIHVVQCQQCGAKNKIPPEKINTPANCGKCGAHIQVDEVQAAQAERLVLRCSQCGTKNRVQSDQIDADPKCGKCGSLIRTKGLFSGKSLMITDSNFDEEVLKSPLPFLLFAWAPWCPTCRTFLPVVDDYARGVKGKVRVGKVNVDASPALSSKFNILSVPQLFVFDKGQLKENMPGAMQKAEIMMKMSRHLLS